MFAYYVHRLDPFIFRLYDSVGPRWYGLGYVGGFVAGYLLLVWFANRGYLDIRPQQVGDFITWAALFGVLVGGRLGYVLFYKPEMLREPLSILRVWEGGMASHGGILGLFFFGLYYSRRHHVSWLNIGDHLCVAAPVGIFFVRCANFINGELYGRPTAAGWAVQFPKELLDSANAAEADRAVRVCQAIDPAITTPDAIVEATRTNSHVVDALRGILTPRHSSQLYEAFAEGILLFAILWFVRTRMRQPNGVLIGLFMICYAVFRIACEQFREPDAPLVGMFTRGQFFSLFLILIGIAFLLAAKMRPTFPAAFKTKT